VADTTTEESWTGESISELFAEVEAFDWAFDVLGMLTRKTKRNRLASRDRRGLTVLFDSTVWKRNIGGTLFPSKFKGFIMP